MEIHTPKHPIRGWRDLLKEVGIIVLGVLIALGAEQSVEAWHWHRKIVDAEQAMVLELRDDAVQRCRLLLTGREIGVELRRDHPIAQRFSAMVPAIWFTWSFATE